MPSSLTRYITPPELKKPLYDSEKGYKIFIWNKYINQAIQHGKKLKIRVSDVGVGIYTPSEWTTGADYMSKVFKRPDEPMKLIGNYFTPGHGLANQEVIVNTNVWERLKPQAKQIGLI